MDEVNDMLKDDKIRICPKCGSINIIQNPKPWEQEANDIVTYNCRLCYNKGNDFPLIKKNLIQQFRINLEKR